MEYLPFNQRVARNIRAEAGWQGYSVATLAQAIKMHRGSLGFRFRNETEFSLSEIETLARLFNVNPLALCSPQGVTQADREAGYPWAKGEKEQLEESNNTI